MKLYYSPGACSLAPHIVAVEAGVKLELDKVDIRAKVTSSGRNFVEINPKGSVPTLELDNGDVLTEGPVISQYIADQVPGSGLVATPGTMGRYRAQEILGFINSEIHKAFGPLFNPQLPVAEREEKISLIKKKYSLIESHLEQHQYLVEDRFSVADAYLFTVTNWAKVHKIDMAGFPQVLTYQKRIFERPAVQAAMRAEGLLG